MLVKQGLSDEPAKTQQQSNELSAAIRELSVFAHLPEENLLQIAPRLERLECSRHEIVINQGDVGAHYYIIESGECEVLREDEDGPPTVYSADSEPEAALLAVLRAGDAFGEEALVSGAPRNATVRMKTDGVLLRLNRDDFSDLVKTPLVHYVDPTRAEDLVALGAIWLDIRTAARHAKDGLERSINVPLRDIRDRVDELHHDKTYVVYCDNAQASAAATFLLCVRGFAACCLEGGLSDVRPATRTIASVPTELEELGAELIEANEQLEQAIQVKAHADAALDVELLSLEDDQLDEQARLAERLRGLETEAASASTAFESAKQRKLELERRIREGTAAAAARKREAQAQLEKMRRDAEQRLAAEKQRLQIRYKEAAEKLQELERERLALEARFEEDRKRLERELDEARTKVENEAKTVREALEGDRRAAEQRAVQIRDAATRAEKQLKDETETALKNEQVRLATEFARSVAEQEQARHDLEEAEGARQSAEREVIQVKSAIAAALDRRRAAEAAEREAEQARRRAEEARLRAEREAAEAKLIAAEARRQLAEATAKMHGSTGAARGQSRAPATPPPDTAPVAAAAPSSDERGDAQASMGATSATVKDISGDTHLSAATELRPVAAADNGSKPVTAEPTQAKHPIEKSNETNGVSSLKRAEAKSEQTAEGAQKQTVPETTTTTDAAATGETAAAPGNPAATATTSKADAPASSETTAAPRNAAVTEMTAKANAAATSKTTAAPRNAAATETTTKNDTAASSKTTAAPGNAGVTETTTKANAVATGETAAAPGNAAATETKSTQPVVAARPSPISPPVLTAVVSKSNASDVNKAPQSATSPNEAAAGSGKQNTASVLSTAGAAASAESEDDEATSLDVIEQQLSQARQAVEQAKQKEQRFAREEKTAAVSKAKEEELRLKLFEEMEDWVEEEREKSERDQERYIQELERLHAEKQTRQKVQQDVNAGLMADVQSVLSGGGKASDDPFEEFIRMRTMAEETGRVVKDAKAALEAQKALSEKALAEANARLSQSRKPDKTS